MDGEGTGHVEGDNEDGLDIEEEQDHAGGCSILMLWMGDGGMLYGFSTMLYLIANVWHFTVFALNYYLEFNVKWLFYKI